MKPGDLILRWVWCDEVCNKVRTPALVIHFDGHTVYWLWPEKGGLGTSFVGDVEVISESR